MQENKKEKKWMNKRMKRRDNGEEIAEKRKRRKDNGKKITEKRKRRRDNGEEITEKRREGGGNELRPGEAGLK